MVPAGMSVVGGGAELVGLALGLDEHAAVATGRDADLDVRVVPDEVAGRERLGRLGPAERAEDAVGDRPGRRGRSAAPTTAAWPPWTSRTWVANSPPTPNIETNDSSSGMSDTPPTSKSKTAPRMSSSRTVISSSPPPTRAQTTKMKSSTGTSIIGARGLPSAGASAPGWTG